MKRLTLSLLTLVLCCSNAGAQSTNKTTRVIDSLEFGPSEVVEKVKKPDAKPGYNVTHRHYGMSTNAPDSPSKKVAAPINQTNQLQSQLQQVIRRYLQPTTRPQLRLPTGNNLTPPPVSSSTNDEQSLAPVQNGGWQAHYGGDLPSYIQQQPGMQMHYGNSSIMDETSPTNENAVPIRTETATPSTGQ